MSGGPRIIAVPPASEEKAAAVCARAVGRGELIVIPTDTVYGISGDVHNPVAISRIYRAKGRPQEMALPVLVASIADAMRLVGGNPPPAAKSVFERFWPGALTVVMPRSEDIPPAVTGGRPTVGLRLPDNDLARAIIAACGGALATTSANLTTHPPACAADELAPELLAHVAVVVDGGRCAGGGASTVLDLSVSPPRVLRAGPISADELREVLPDLALD